VTLHKRNELQRAQWDAYQARQDVSVVERVLTSPITFGICLAALCAVPVIAVIVCLG
jgi:hypothetical protein